MAFKILRLHILTYKGRIFHCLNILVNCCGAMHLKVYFQEGSGKTHVFDDPLPTTAANVNSLW